MVKNEEDIKIAVDWALKQKFIIEEGLKEDVKNNNKINHHGLVHKVREYFNDNNIDYDSFNFKDLKPYI